MISASPPRLPFIKYQGSGNDFILLNSRAVQEQNQGTPGRPSTWLYQKLIQKLCDRHFGIGADGLILLEKLPPETLETQSSAAAFYMHYYNADGLPGSLCGNGGRCAVHCAAALGWCERELQFEAYDGLHQAEILADGRISLHMHAPTAWEHKGSDWVMDTGSPHYVSFSEQTPELDVVQRGRAIRYSAPYAEQGINVNFAGPGSGSPSEPLIMRTYERGVENETLACGTGATAVALSFALERQLQGEQDLYLSSPGGILQLRFDLREGTFSRIRLIGPAEPVFSGVWPAE